MASESSVAPKERVNITYKAATGDGTEEIELPNKMLVLGDFTLREEDEELEEREKVSVNKANFSDVMARHKLSLNLTVGDKLSGADDDEMAIKLNIDSIKSFEPESIADQVPELKKLLALREALAFLKGPLGNIPAFRKQLDSLLEDKESRDKLIQELAIDKQ